MKVDTQSAPSYSELLKANESKTAEKLGEEFEAFFISSMLKEMGKATHTTKKSFMEETYTAIMYEKIGEHVAQKKGIGIKEMVLKYVERTEETKVSDETGDNKVK
jgi:Rod binding domain-containing protein